MYDWNMWYERNKQTQNPALQTCNPFVSSLQWVKLKQWMARFILQPTILQPLYLGQFYSFICRNCIHLLCIHLPLYYPFAYLPLTPLRWGLTSNSFSWPVDNASSSSALAFSRVYRAWALYDIIRLLELVVDLGSRLYDTML